MPTLTNSYDDVKILNLAGKTGKGPYLALQIGVAPGDSGMRERTYLLRPDGKWVDLNACVSQGKPDMLDKLVFDSMGQIAGLLGNLSGLAEVEPIPYNEEGLKLWLERKKCGGSLQSVHAWVEEYKERHRLRD